MLLRGDLRTGGRSTARCPTRSAGSARSRPRSPARGRNSEPRTRRRSWHRSRGRPAGLRPRGLRRWPGPLRGFDDAHQDAQAGAVQVADLVVWPVALAGRTLEVLPRQLEFDPTEAHVADGANRRASVAVRVDLDAVAEEAGRRGRRRGAATKALAPLGCLALPPPGPWRRWRLPASRRSTLCCRWTFAPATTSHPGSCPRSAAYVRRAVGRHGCSRCPVRRAS